MGTYLDRILEHHRSVAGSDTRDTRTLTEECLGLGPTRGFRAALESGDTLAVISEVKRRSPSKGDLAADLDPARLARTYGSAGASCLSVLTDGPHFGGSSEDLQAARAAVELPVLRKDFTVSANDVLDARLMGADAVLLIAAALDDAELSAFASLARSVGLDVLFEVHEEAEVSRVDGLADVDLVGVNQRDLVTFEVDRERAVRVAESIPSTVVRVAESGVRGHEDAVALAAAGYHAVLVGEHLVTADDTAGAVAGLRVPRR